jgi:endonuclease VIII
MKEKCAMEGPSIVILKEQLSPFIGKQVKRVSGNTSIAKELIKGKKLTGVFSWGKQLLMQFDDLILKTHFLMHGSYKINEEREGKTPRISFQFPNGFVNFYSCSVKYLEDSMENSYDWRTDVMSEKWDEKEVLKRIKSQPNELISDVLLDQDIFTGVGNIIKNEVLFNLKIHPMTKIKELSRSQLKALIAEAVDYSWKFYEWRKTFQLRKNYKIYFKSMCPECHTKTIKEKTGKWNRWTFFCPACQAKVPVISKRTIAPLKRVAALSRKKKTVKR